MQNNVIQVLASGLLIAASVAPGASAEPTDLAALAVLWAEEVTECASAGNCHEKLQGVGERCLAEDFGLCYVCYDFHGADVNPDNMGPVQSLQDAIMSSGTDEGHGEIRFGGYGFDPSNKETYGEHVIGWDETGDAPCAA